MPSLFPNHLEPTQAPISNPNNEELQSVTLSPTKPTLVTLYENITQVNDVFEFIATQKKTNLDYHPLFDQLLKDSAFFYIESGNGQITQQSFKQNCSSLKDVFAKQLGKTLEISANFNGLLRNFTGQLSAMEGNQVILQSEAQGWIKLSLDQIIGVKGFKFPYQEMSNKCSFNAQYEANSQEEVQGQIVYLSQGIKWSPHYKVVIEKDEAGEVSAQLLSQLEIINQTQKAFKNLMVQIVSGELQYGSARPAPVNYARMENCLAAHGAKSEVIDQLWNEYKAYLVPKNIDLSPNEHLFTTLFAPKQVKLKKSYVVKNQEHFTGSQSPKITYLMENTQENQLGQAFPKGTIQVFENKDLGLQFMGQDYMPNTPSNQSIEFTSGRSFDLGAKRSTEIKYIKDAKNKVIAHEVTVHLEFTNAKEEAQRIELIEQLNGDIQIINSSFSFDYDKIKGLKAQVLVPENASSEKPFKLSYTYRKNLSH